MCSEIKIAMNYLVFYDVSGYYINNYTYYKKLPHRVDFNNQKVPTGHITIPGLCPISIDRREDY